nr:hypothetical protein [Tanacetum cinerariifolium]
MYTTSLKRSDNYKALPYQYASPSKQILKVKAKPFSPCTHYGFNDHRPDDCRNYPESEIYESYDHFTSAHNHVIHIKAGVLGESSQSSESSIGIKCNTCRSTIHSTTDHNEFDHFKRGEKIKAINSIEPTKKWDRWSRYQHIELVNIIGDPGKGMLTRSIPVKLTAASTSECLFADFLSEIELKNVSKALKHLGLEKMEAIRIFLVFAIYMNFKVYQVDVKSAFLNGKLKEKVYVKQPPGFESRKFPYYVCPEYAQDETFGSSPTMLSNSNSLRDPSKVTLIELTAFIGLEAFGSLSKKRKQPNPKKTPTETKVTPAPKLTKGSEHSYSVSSGTVHDHQDLERNIQLAGMGLPFTSPDKGIHKSQPLLEGTVTDPKDSVGNKQPIDMGLPSTTSNEGTAKTMPRPKRPLGDKDSRGNKTPIDMKPINPTIADPLGTCVNYKVDQTQSTRLRAFLLSDDEAQESKEDILGAGEEGTEGVIGLSCWFEKMELVFHISGCGIENQVKFATCTLLDAALTWWNGHLRTLGHDAAYAMTWETLKKKMTKKYCPRGEIKTLEIELPKTLDEAIELANDLMDQKLHTYAERQTESQRKFDNNNQAQQLPKRQNVAQAYVVWTGERNEYAGTLLLCNKFSSNLPFKITFATWKAFVDDKLAWEDLWNRVAIKTLISHKIFKVSNNNILVMKAMGGPHETFQYQQVIFYEPCCENCIGPHKTIQFQPMDYYEPNPCYDSFVFDKFQPSQSVIDHLNLQQRISDSMIELCGTLQAWLQQRKNQVVNLDSYSSKSLQCQKILINYDDDDDEESSTPLRDIIISKLPACIEVTPILSTKETKDSLIMGDEHLDTIPEKESDEFIKSSVENLVPNPSESEDLSNIRREWDVPVCDDFTTFLIFSSMLTTIFPL